jgi:hypothetical protein
VGIQLATLSSHDGNIEFSQNLNPGHIELKVQYWVQNLNPGQDTREQATKRTGHETSTNRIKHEALAVNQKLL